MVVRFFQSLFKYDLWANSQIIAGLEHGKQSSEKALKLLAHILGSQFVWLARLTGDSPKASLIWPEWTLENCKASLQQLEKRWPEFLNKQTEDNIADKVNYQNTQGRTFETPVRDILMHVITHSSYHRGQIAKALREVGETPVNTDYITFIRNRINDVGRKKVSL